MPCILKLDMTFFIYRYSTEKKLKIFLRGFKLKDLFFAGKISLSSTRTRKSLNFSEKISDIKEFVWKCFSSICPYFVLYLLLSEYIYQNCWSMSQSLLASMNRCYFDLLLTFAPKKSDLDINKSKLPNSCITRCLAKIFKSYSINRIT